MFAHHLKFTLRNLWKTRGYSLLNIIGLAVGIMVASLIFLWIEDEVSYNNYFENKSNIYSIKNLQTYDGQTFVFSATPGLLAPSLKEDFSEISQASRATWATKNLFSIDEKKVYENGLFTDPEFLHIFSVKLIQGTPEENLKNPEQILISRSMAQRFFNRTEVTGETLYVNSTTPLIISGVFEDLPDNVSVQFDWLRPYEVYLKENDWLNHWGNNGIQTFVLLQETGNLKSLNDRIYSYINDKSKNTSYNAKLQLYPMERWHLYNAFKDGVEVEGKIKYVRLFSIIAWIVLIIACINYMNLSTSRSQKRAKEIGIKKVVGATRNLIIKQFLIESVIISVIACVLALILAQFMLPYFNELVGKELKLNLFESKHILFLLSIILGTGVLAGSYPAFYLSSFKPIQVLKNQLVKSGGSNLIRRGLVVIQFTASITLIICSILIYMQIQYAQKKDVGYNKTGVIMTQLNEKTRAHYQTLVHELKNQGLIKNGGRSEHNILNLGSNTADFTWEGKDPNKETLITIEYGDGSYLETLEFKLLQGRFFKDPILSDSGNVIINQKFAEIMGIADHPIGKTVLRSWGETYTIIGVIDDFMVTNVYSESEPFIIHPILDNSGEILTMRLPDQGNFNEIIPQIEAVFKKYNPEYPFEYRFVEDTFKNMFKTESLVGEISKVFAFFAILISCLGLFGLASYTAERRTKEIGIRKVLGASIQKIVYMLSFEFALLILIACLLAFPLSYWIMSNWLNNYSYRIEIPWWIFAISGLLAFAIGMLTVSFQSVKASLLKPVVALKND